LFAFTGKAQQTKIGIKALLLPQTNQLAVQQRIVYTNKSDNFLQNIVLHNWPNSFKDRKTTLSKRMIENHKKSLYFADSVDTGLTNIQRVALNFKKTDNYKIYNRQSDLLEITLENKLAPNDSIILTINYSIRIPNNKFTGYGRSPEGNYNLRYWYLVPAVYKNLKWHAYSNIDIDHMYMDVADYNLNINVPIGYHVNSSLTSELSYTKNLAVFKLKGKNRVDLQLNITRNGSYSFYNTDAVKVISNIESKELSNSIKKTILNRELDFIKDYLGAYPHKEILIDKESYLKNKVQGLDLIPQFLSSFPDVFEWDLKLFKALSRKFIEHTLLLDKNKDYWLIDGIQTYLLMQYTNKYYPEAKLFGKISKTWGLRKFNLSQMNFNDKYPFVYQFSARKNIDQSLTTQIDSLSNFNRKIVNKYKAGLGLRYLDQFLGNGILQKSLKEYFENYKLRRSTSQDFQTILLKNSNKDLGWFFGDYLQSKKKIDYTLKKIRKTNDSLFITIKNKRNITAPVALYGVKDKKIKWKKWITGVDKTKTIGIPKGDYDKISLNYEYLYPEFNLRNNWKNINPKLFERPLQFKFIKDLNDPYYHQIYYKPSFNYNYYDGVILGMGFSNKPLLKNNLEYKIVPAYGTKSNAISGKFSIKYNYLPENKLIYKLTFGASGNTYHYTENLSYKTFNPSITLRFNRKTLRVAGNNSINLRYLMIQKETPPGQAISDENRYNIWKLGYTFSKPEIINDFKFQTSIEFADKFSKFTTTTHFRKLTNKHRQFDFRLYTGIFINNRTDTNSNYFSFGLSKPQDYLFEYNLFGRSEDTGFINQQFINAEGGFKSFYTQKHHQFANSWMTTLNTSVSLWNWLEAYNDFGLLKSTNTPVFFAHESGLRCNFINTIFELYFPIHSNSGWEIGQNNYTEKIRFTLTLDITKIFNFARRGFL